MSLPDNSSNFIFLLKIITLFLVLALGFLHPKSIDKGNSENISEIKNINVGKSVMAKKTLFD
ncbi:MAG: hypothetical protein ACK4ND_03685 [Cytophagaceae bacterium]